MNAPRALQLHAFGAKGDPLVVASLGKPSNQINYLRCYLTDLGAKTVLEEPNYFDRDYLSEFAAFYGTSSNGYPNVCRRLHFFDRDIKRPLVRQALGGNATADAELRASYLGHVVLRPIAGAPLGRTVLKLYPDPTAATTPRIMNAARPYESHVAGITLRVDGLAWQQQDSAVGACATVALWSMLHAAAFDAHHSIPTTADITAAANKTASLGARVFPTAGLTIAQVLEAIKHFELSPVVVPGDRERGEGISEVKFKRTVASFLRSGYPVLLRGRLQDEEYSSHVMCAVGFRSTTPPPAPADEGYSFRDDAIEHLYVHDDNLGPNVRFRIEIDELTGVVQLRPDAPPPRRKRPVADPTVNYPLFVPSDLIVAVNHELRTDPMKFQEAAIKAAHWLPDALSHMRRRQGLPPSSVAFTARFMRLGDYIGGDLASVLQGSPSALARVRLALVEKLRPLSLHIGVLRATISDFPVMDILFDTSDSDRHLEPTVSIAFAEHVPWLLGQFRKLVGEDPRLGTPIRGW